MYKTVFAFGALLISPIQVISQAPTLVEVSYVQCAFHEEEGPAQRLEEWSKINDDDDGGCDDVFKEEQAANPLSPQVTYSNTY